MRRPRLLIADDHPVVMAGLRQILEPRFEVVGTAQDGRMLVALASALKPDVILLDISMPLLNGLTAARQIKLSLPKVKLIFLTVHAEVDFVAEAFRAGASGYILKESLASELIRAVESVLKGRAYLSAVIEKGFNGRLPGSLIKGGLPSHSITVRQREVLQLLAEGHSAKEIAAILHVTPKTVEFHKFMIRRKLRLRGTADLIKYAINHKIVGT